MKGISRLNEFEIKQSTTEFSNQAVCLDIKNSADYKKVLEILKSIKAQRKI